MGVVLLLGACLQASAYAQASPVFKVLFSFNSVNGAFPFAGVIGDSAGNLYGTTKFAQGTGTGNVFKLAPNGTETVLFNFTGGTDGGHPEGGLLRDSAGNLYGTTQDGGDLNCFITRGSGGCGVVFKLDPLGHETVLHSFSGADGGKPDASLIRDAAGNLYGTTEDGGNLQCTLGSGQGCGVVFKLSPTGQETVLHSFSGPADGAFPSSALVIDPAGNLYGTTGSGGAHSGGTVFKLDPAGVETVLHSFGGGKDGTFPFAGVIRDSAGNLYGTTTAGGSNGFGSIFRLDPHGNETVLHSFAGTGGEMPTGGLLRDAAGNLFGTTAFGGDLSCMSGAGQGCGTAFRLDTTRKLTVLHVFRDLTDGANPTSAFILDAAGHLDGTVTNGTSQGFGAVFSMTP
jgi:uncharacterized repeat protein (TIGR03803 family)